MNTQIATRLVSLASAVLVTLVMLAGVDILAGSEPGSGQMAQTAPASKG